MQLRTFVRTLFLFVGIAFVAAACGAQIQEDSKDGSNFNPDEWKTNDKQVVTVTAKKEVQTGPRDPDGLLHRVSPELHPQLAEVRIDPDEKILLVFRSGEAIKLAPEDLSQIHLIEAKAGKLLVRVRTQDFHLRAAP